MNMENKPLERVLKSIFRHSKIHPLERLGVAVAARVAHTHMLLVAC